MKQGFAVVMKPAQEALPPSSVTLGQALERMTALYDSIARRAFEIFEGRGRTDGYDLNDWVRAEAELFHSTHLDVAESADALTVRAEVPGFSAHELEISIEPRRLIILGKRDFKNQPPRNVLYCDHCADQIFRTLGLPADVDPEKASAALHDGILELAIPKAARFVSIKTDSIVRMEDYRSWSEPLMRLLSSKP